MSEPIVHDQDDDKGVIIESNLDPGDWGSWTQILSSSTLQPFDLIEISRFKGVYQHWVMYLGEGNVIHVTQVKGRTEGSLAEKRVDKLSSIARDDPCRINNLCGPAATRGLTLMSRPHILDSIRDVVQGQGALTLEPKVSLVPYSVSGTNCEYYATYWKFGVGFSTQIEDSEPFNAERIRASVELAEDFEDEEASRQLIYEFMTTLI